MDSKTTKKRMEGILTGLTYYYASGLVQPINGQDRPTARWVARWYLYWKGFGCFVRSVTGKGDSKDHLGGYDVAAEGPPKNKLH